MSMMLGMKSSTFAKECASRCGIETLPGLSVGESLMVDHVKSGQPLRLRNEFTQRVRDYTQLTTDFDSQKYPLVFSNACGNVLCLNRDDGIFVFLTSEGVNVLIINTDINDDVLVDEESFCIGDDADYPLYFSQSAHYVSPIFTLHVIGKILELVLELSGYPTFETHLIALFNNHNACLLNADEYEKGGEHESEWRDVEIYLRQDYPSDYIFTAAKCFFPSPDVDSPENKIRTELIHAFAATAILYDELKKDNKLLIKSNELRKFVRMSEIFIDKKRKCLIV